MPFQHDLAGGQGNLIATSLQSPNFVPGTSGWIVRKDGSAEFHSIVVPPGSGGASVYFQSTAPTTHNTGDLWYNTANGLQLSQWSGSAWTSYQIGSGAIQAGAIVAGLVAAGAIDGFVINGVTINGNTINATDVIISGTNGGDFVYSSGGTIVQTFTSSGTWTAPVGVTSAKVECWGGGGGGAGGSSTTGNWGAGGGEYAAENTNTVTPGNVYTVTVGAAGPRGAINGNGGNGGTTTFSGTGATTVTANGGSAGANGSGGTGSTNSAHFDGGAGGGTVSTGGSGGGGSGGTASAGNTGGNVTGGGSIGGAGAAAVSGGGAGGAGGNANAGGLNGSSPGGAGGGGGTNSTGGNGAHGQVRVTYTSTTPALVAALAGAVGTDPVAGAGVGPGLSLFNQSSVPAAVANAALLWAAGGHEKYVGADGQAYNTGRLSQQTTSTQQFTLASAVAVTGLSAALGVGTYRVHLKLFFVPSGTVGSNHTHKFAFTGTATANVNGACWQAQSANAIQQSTVNNQTGAIGTILNSPTHVAFPGWLDAEATITVTVAGTLTTTVTLGTAGDDITTSPGSFWDICPVT